MSNSAVTLEGVHYASGHPVRVSIQDGVISSIEHVHTADLSSRSRIGPGLVDLQINGYNGLDLTPFRLRKAWSSKRPGSCSVKESLRIIRL
jgi:N-acetylglucosamine-6-phosphate deacetylase